MNALNGEIGNVDETPIEKLSLMHTANGEDFLSILSEQKIRTADCKVFRSEKLAYFFLGRPAYKTAVAPDPSFWQLPAVFILKKFPEAKPIRIFPFDSGGLAEKRYEKIIGKIKLENFELTGEGEQIAKAIKYFFGDQERYLSAKAIPYEVVADRIGERTSAFPTLALSKLYNHNFNEIIDDRVRLIEFQFDQDIDLSGGNLRAVIICREWLRDPAIKEMLEATGCDVKTYPLFPLRSSDYYSRIYELAMEACGG